MNLQRQRLFGILILLVAVALGYFKVWPGITQAYGDFLQMQKVQQELGDLRFLIQNKSHYVQRYQQFKVANPVLFKALAEKFSESDPIASLNALANTAGQQLSAVDIQKPDQQGLVALTGTFNGTLDTFEQLLRMLGNTLPFFDFVGTRMESSIKGQTLMVELQTFSIPLIAPSDVHPSYTDLKAQLEQALSTPASLADNERVRLFKPAAQVPVPLPSADALGGHDPFRP